MVWRASTFGGIWFLEGLLSVLLVLLFLSPRISITYSFYFSFHFISFAIFYRPLATFFSIGLGVVDTGTAGNLVSSSFLSPTCFLLEVDFSISTLYRSPGVSNEFIPIRACRYFVFYCDRQSFLFFFFFDLRRPRKASIWAPGWIPNRSSLCARKGKA